ncbi:MAG: thioesterase family protein [Desulfobacterium sp.]|nr:thioesterase family protein [Desulfobacterium sp.]
MARVEIKMIDRFLFETELIIKKADINIANHVGNDTFVSLMQEARIRFFKHLGYMDLDIEGRGIIISDLAVVYKSQSYLGDRLKVELGVGDFNKYGCDIFYQLTNSETSALVIQAKNGIVFFDYAKNRVSTIPEKFKSRFL